MRFFQNFKITVHQYFTHTALTFDQIVFTNRNAKTKLFIGQPLKQLSSQKFTVSHNMGNDNVQKKRSKRSIKVIRSCVLQVPLPLFSNYQKTGMTTYMIHNDQPDSRRNEMLLWYQGKHSANFHRL